MLPSEWDKILEQIAFNVGHHRRLDKLGQESLSRESGVGDRTVGLIESGRRGLSVKTLYKIADALGIQPHDLLPRLDRDHLR